MLVGLFIVSAITCVVSSVLTMLVCKTAPRLGLIDTPDNHRKLHSKPIALGGGVAVFLATSIILLGLLVLPSTFRVGLQAHWPKLIALPLASLVIVIVGLIDDRRGLRGRQKLLGQILAASIVIAGGLVIREIGIFGLQIELGLLSLPFTLFWLLGAVNALNLLDGLDGLATMLGIILVSTIGVMAVMTGNHQIALIAMVFAGSLLGFMPFNFPPARVFLGDAGSMLIGLVVGVLAIQGTLKGPGTVLLAAPLAVWALPIFDSTAAILRRKLAGRSIYTTDCRHLHHRLLERFGSHRKVLSFVGISCVLTSAAALLTVWSKNDLIALLTCAALIAIFIITGLFGRTEFLLALGHLRRIARNFMAQLVSPQSSPPPAVVQRQGARRWDLIWETLIESAERLSLSRITLNLSFPISRKGFNGTWERSASDDTERCWRMEVPLLVEGRPVGRLTVFGQRNGQPACREIECSLDLLEEFETQLLAMADQEFPVSVLAQPFSLHEPKSSLDLTQKHPK
ncbi:MAG: undecaprenyl/decaprenyl-phosphate alpha-N-acetylglucosaminyl 1-phosphate transferase [Planctomycetes bacterium]|nr:undecaprenyl/decaprenyl-phosphate alpha-N-acetylglucosaminyl 1-phosphate transferase [Planctomycetota bacterium]